MYMPIVAFLQSLFTRKARKSNGDKNYTHIIYHTGSGGHIYCYSSLEYIAEIKNLSLNGIKVDNIVVNF